MSVRCMSWVWDHSTARGNDRLVLLAIADNAEDDGTDAYPAISTLARKTLLAESTIKLAIKRLVLAGALSVEVNAGIGKRRKTNRYTVSMAEQPILGPSPEQPIREPEQPTEPGRTADLVGYEPSLVLEPPLEPSPQSPSDSCPPDKLYESLSDGFDAFWDLFPRKVEKRAAEKAYAQRLKAGADPDDLIHGAAVYAKWCESGGVESPKFVKHPTTWLNKGCELDELPMPEAMRKIHPVDRCVMELVTGRTNGRATGRDDLGDGIGGVGLGHSAVNPRRLAQRADDAAGPRSGGGRRS